MEAPHAEPQRVFQKIEYITGFWEPPSGMAVSCAETTGRFMYPSKTMMTNIFLAGVSYAWVARIFSAS